MFICDEIMVRIFFCEKMDFSRLYPPTKKKFHPLLHNYQISIAQPVSHSDSQ